MKRLFLVLVLGLLVAPRLIAHDEYRIIGKVTRLTQSSIAVENTNSKTMAARIDKQTEITRDKKKVALSELKVGQSVVVDALGDNESDLLAIEIRIVPPPRGR
jgi:hypothetical protein